MAGAREDPSRRWCWASLGLVGAVTCIRFWVAGRVGLGDAEAYYWTWSRELAWSYLDHGPAVALLIRLGTALLGDTPLGVRAPFIVVSAACMLLLARVAADLAPSRWRAGLWVLVALLAMPMALVAGGAANPDVPLLLCVALFVMLTPALADPQAHAPVARVAAAGLVVGLAACCKLLGLLLLPSLLGVLGSPRRRRGLLWAVALVGTVVGALPVLYWNARQGFPSIAYHLGWRHAYSTIPVGPSLANAAKLVGGQLAYVSPFVLVGLVAAAVHAWRARRTDARARVLLWAAAPAWVAGCGLILLVPGAEPHWPAMGYVPLLVVLGLRVPEWIARSRAARGLVTAGVGYAILVGIALHGMILADSWIRWIPSYRPRLDLSNELRGWPAVAEAIATEKALSRPGARPLVVGACHYTTCGQLRFAARDRFELACPSPRLDQFDYFAGGDGSDRRGFDLLYVRDERFPFDASTLYRCASVRRVQEIAICRAGLVTRRFALERCLGFEGLKATGWPPPARGGHDVEAMRSPAPCRAAPRSPREPRGPATSSR